MRRPAHIERAGALTPRDRIWAAIRLFPNGEEFSVAEVMVVSGQRDDTALPYLNGLTIAGYLAPGANERAAVMRRRELRRFKLVRDVGVDAPRVSNDGKPVTQGVGREQLWRSMRVLKQFDCRELALAASTAAHQVGLEETKNYVKFLRLAGYLRIVKPSRSKFPARYAFIKSRDTGPRSPLLTAERTVVDGNTGDIVYDPKAEAQEGRK